MSINGTAMAKVYSWIGGDRPGDVLEQAKIRKEKGFTAVKVRSRLALSLQKTCELHPLMHR
jgi:galactonate dehydratase